MAQVVPASEVPVRMSRKTQKERLLLQIKSLDENDDDRTSISKKISWILRHGAKQAGVRQDRPSKWVKFHDLCQAEILKEFSEEMVWQVIVDFNGKKLRYEIMEEGDTKYIRPYNRVQRKALEAGVEASPTAAAEKTADRPHTGGLRQDAPEFAPQHTEVVVPQQQFPASPTATATATAMAQAQAQAQQQATAYYAMTQQFQQAAMFNYGYPAMAASTWNPFMWQQAAAVAAATSGKFQGRIKSFNQEKGFGFIECPQTYQQYNRDVFLHKANIGQNEAQVGELQVNSWVLFSCEVNKMGLPQAKDLLPMPGQAPSTPTSPKGCGKDAGKGKGTKGGQDRKGKGEGRGAGRKGKGEGKGEKADEKKEEKEESTDEKEEKKEEKDNAEVPAAAEAAAAPAIALEAGGAAVKEAPAAAAPVAAADPPVAAEAAAS